MTETLQAQHGGLVRILTTLKRARKGMRTSLIREKDFWLNAKW